MHFLVTLASVTHNNLFLQRAHYAYVNDHCRHHHPYIIINYSRLLPHSPPLIYHRPSLIMDSINPQSINGVCTSLQKILEFNALPMKMKCYCSDREIIVLKYCTSCKNNDIKNHEIWSLELSFFLCVKALKIGTDSNNGVDIVIFVSWPTLNK